MREAFAGPLRSLREMSENFLAKIAKRGIAKNAK